MEICFYFLCRKYIFDVGINWFDHGTRWKGVILCRLWIATAHLMAIWPVYVKNKQGHLNASTGIICQGPLATSLTPQWAELNVIQSVLHHFERNVFALWSNLSASCINGVNVVVPHWLSRVMEAFMQASDENHFSSQTVTLEAESREHWHYPNLWNQRFQIKLKDKTTTDLFFSSAARPWPSMTPAKKSLRLGWTHISVCVLNLLISMFLNRVWS